MFWQKKKGMVNIGKMAEQGRIKMPAPRKPSNLKLSRDGFVEVNSTLTNMETAADMANTTQAQVEKKDSGFFDFLGFGNSASNSNNSNEQTSFSTQENGYNKREVDVKIEELDNKIYKLEQRIEVLERKTGVGSNNW
jgi:hypothetical protein